MACFGIFDSREEVIDNLHLLLLCSIIFKDIINITLLVDSFDNIIQLIITFWYFKFDFVYFEFRIIWFRTVFINFFVLVSFLH